MQELLEWVRKTLPMDLDYPQMIEAKIESMLDKERKQIEDAFKHGKHIHPAHRNFSEKEYYEITF